MLGIDLKGTRGAWGDFGWFKLQMSQMVHQIKLIHKPKPNPNNSAPQQFMDMAIWSVSWYDKKAATRSNPSPESSWSRCSVVVTVRSITFVVGKRGKGYIGHICEELRVDMSSMY
jgi:hypothetical protein